MTDTDRAILIVDDDEDIRELLAEFLRDAGYRVLTAKNGLDALASLRSGVYLPCLILLDLMMPLMNGFQFLEVARHDPGLASIPIAVVTAHSALDDEAVAAMGAPILSKPLQLPALLALVASLC